MGGTVFFQGNSEIAVIGNVFSVSGAPTDPTLIYIVVTDPAGTAVTHTYAGASPADVVRNSAGNYQLSQPCTTEGMWSYVWVGTGAASDITAGTFSVSPTYLNRFYCSVAELKARIGMDPADTSDDDQLLLAAQSATRGIDQYCGRYFWQAADTRVFNTQDIETCKVDDLVSITTMLTDSTGLSTYDQTWAATDYRLEPANAPGFNPEPRPYTLIRAMAGGGGRYWFPWIYPLSNPDRVKITGVFGWPAVPYLVKQVALQAAVDIYKLKDSPFGVLGSADMGIMQVTANPHMSDMLWSYVRGRSKVGM